MSRNKSVIDDFISSLQNRKEKYILTDEGEIDKYLGVDIIKSANLVTMKQPYLIERCLTEMGITDDVNIKKVPASTPLLHKDKEGSPRQHTWHYRTVIGMLNYLKCSTRSDLAMAVHQCARFCEDPKRSHELAVRQIGKYLLGTKNKGIIFKPDHTKGLECYVDAAFAAGWQEADSDNPEMFYQELDM